MQRATAKGHSLALNPFKREATGNISLPVTSFDFDAVSVKA